LRFPTIEGCHNASGRDELNASELDLIQATQQDLSPKERHAASWDYRAQTLIQNQINIDVWLSELARAAETSFTNSIVLPAKTKICTEKTTKHNSPCAYHPRPKNQVHHRPNQPTKTLTAYKHLTHPLGGLAFGKRSTQSSFILIPVA
jgi:hypothetical protein